MIRLDGGYAISVDSQCYVLGIPKMMTQVDKKTHVETVKEVLTETHYYADLDQALLGYWKIMRRQKLSKFEGSFEEAMSVVRKQNEEIRRMIESVKEGN